MSSYIKVELESSHTHTHTHTGSLDRCVDGETAKTILENTSDVVTPDQLTTAQSFPIHVRSVGVSGSDSLIQVLIFEPQHLITRLSRMEKLSKEVPKKKTEAPKKQGEAFKTYLMARRQFGSGTMYPYGQNELYNTNCHVLSLSLTHTHTHTHTHTQVQQVEPHQDAPQCQ